jgi:integrase
MGFRTQREVDSLKAPAGRADAYVYDDETPGLSIRFQKGQRRWVVHYSAAGTRRRVTLGSVAELKLAEARAQAGDIMRGARKGEDELAKREAARKEAEQAKAKQGDSVRRLFDLYLARHAKPKQRPRSYAETERFLLKVAAPLHHRDVETLNRRDIAELLATVQVERGGITANRVRAALSAAFAWAMRDGIVDSNPVVGTSRPVDEHSRDRVLTDAELSAIWKASEGEGDFGRIVRLLALTAARRDEVGGMEWAELDLEVAEWRLPAARCKGKRELVLPLSDAALAILGSVERREGRKLVFGRGTGGFSGWSASKARLDKASGVTGWRLHDLRRTAASGMAGLGVLPAVLSAILNHSAAEVQGITSIYNRHAYAAEKRDAINRWAVHLAAVVEGKASNVVALRA